jgi:aminopeptidase YwaD
MNKILTSLLFILLISGIHNSNLRSQTNVDSLIHSIISQVDADSVAHHIQSLQDFQTRFMLAENRYQVADWLYDRFTSFGFTDIERDSFMCHTSFGGGSTTQQQNIIATLTGTSRPDEVYIIGGHYDSFAYGSPLTDAPGADDNGSGTSAVLEMARVIMESGYQPEATIKFITFGAEELMLYGDAGCEHYAQNAYNEGMNIQLMINCDMISYNTLPLEDAKVSINYYSGFTYLLEIAIDVTNQFSLITGVTGSLNQYSDSYPFYEKGFPAVYFEEDQFSPYYHTIDDVITNYDMDYCAEVIKSAGAMLLRYMEMNTPTYIQNEELLVEDFTLYQNYPNPFNPVTNIGFTISEFEFVSLKIYDILGNEIATLVNEKKQPGTYVVEFHAADLSSGIYFYLLQAGSSIEMKKMILMK